MLLGVELDGVELDGVLLAWGTDLLWSGDAWSNARAKNHARGTHVRDPYQLRVNAYRVLLTRGRDGAVIFVPPLAELDATAARLGGMGSRCSKPSPRHSPRSLDCHSVRALRTRLRWRHAPSLPRRIRQP